MRTALVFLMASGVIGLAMAAGPDASTNTAKVSALISLIDEVEVPAEEAGRLVSLEAREGLEVTAGAVLGRIDDEQALNLKKVAKAQQRSADEEAKNDVKVRYAKEAAKLAEAEYQQSLEANRKHIGTVSQAEERRKLLAFKSAKLQIEQAELEQRIAALTCESKTAEVEAAEAAIERRKIKAPLEGLIVDVLKEQGEWVQPGEPVLKIVRIDRLRVKGYLNASEHGPEEVGHRPVTVEVTLARGRIERFPGKVVFVNPLVESNGKYFVWAEVVNRSENGQWLLRPGLQANMSIDLARTAAGTVGSKTPARRSYRE